MKSDVSCNTALQCATKGAAMVVFPNSCLPEGWKAEKWETCCKPKPATCDKGAAATLSKVCVRPVGGGKELKAGAAAEVVVYPKGCMSSSCTKKHKTVCEVKGKDGKLTVTGLICLENTGGGGPCTADCNGGGFATCQTTTLKAGSYTVTLGGETVSFKVPSTLGNFGLCAGKQW